MVEPRAWLDIAGRSTDARKGIDAVGPPVPVLPFCGPCAGYLPDQGGRGPWGGQATGSKRAMPGSPDRSFRRGHLDGDVDWRAWSPSGRCSARWPWPRRARCCRSRSRPGSLRSNAAGRESSEVDVGRGRERNRAAGRSYCSTAVDVQRKGTGGLGAGEDDVVPGIVVERPGTQTLVSEPPPTPPMTLPWQKETPKSLANPPNSASTRPAPCHHWVHVVP